MSSHSYSSSGTTTYYILWLNSKTCKKNFEWILLLHLRNLLTVFGFSFLCWVLVKAWVKIWQQTIYDPVCFGIYYIFQSIYQKNHKEMGYMILCYVTLKAWQDKRAIIHSSNKKLGSFICIIENYHSYSGNSGTLALQACRKGTAK